MDAFFAAVEQHDRPELRGKPVVVGAPPDQRGVVAAASYEARKFGIHSAMPSREAGQRCPHAVFVPVNGRRYQEVSGHMFSILERFTPLIEPLSIDEAFLDVTGARRLLGTGKEIAGQVKQTIRCETGLTASVGVAPNKFLAKLASDLEKPDGLTVVPAGQDEVMAFLGPLPVSRIWGVGKVTRGRLEAAGIRRIAELQATPLGRLAGIVGKNSAEHLRALAHGRDQRDIELEREAKSISREHTFPEDCACAETLERVLCELVEDVGTRLRGAGKYAALGHLKLRWKGFKTITRQEPFPRPCCDDFALRSAALKLFHAEALVKPVRLIGFGVSRLGDSPGIQLSLFGTDVPARDRREDVSRAVDQLRRKFGKTTIGSGRTAGGKSAR